jgi:hypothetical protein
VIAALGSQRQRYQTAHEVQCHSGIAPVVATTGEQRWFTGAGPAPNSYGRHFMNGHSIRSLTRNGPETTTRSSAPKESPATPLSGPWRSNGSAFCFELQFHVSYNLARNLSDVGGHNPTSFAGGNGGTVTDNYDPYLDYGNVAFTRRQRFQTTFLYELPFNHTGSKVLKQVVGGWELAGVMLFQTGPFLTVLANGADPSGTNFVNLIGNGRADIVIGGPTAAPNQSIHDWINPAAFAIPANNIGRFGDSPVGSVIGPGTQAVSLSLFRSFKVAEKAQFRLGMAAANALNHPNYAPPCANGLTLGTSTFGVISSLQAAEGTGPRAIQLSGRLTF